jgi:hypothetical protein
MNGHSLFSIWLGLSLGHFAYQFLTQALYGVALERTFFTGCALLTVWVIGKARA